MIREGIDQRGREFRGGSRADTAFTVIDRGGDFLSDLLDLRGRETKLKGAAQLLLGGANRERPFTSGRAYLDTRGFHERTRDVAIGTRSSQLLGNALKGSQPSVKRVEGCRGEYPVY